MSSQLGGKQKKKEEYNGSYVENISRVEFHARKFDSAKDSEGVSGFSKLVVKDWFLSHSDIQGGEQLSLSVVLKGPAEAEP